MHSGVVFVAAILKGYTFVTVSTPSGSDEVWELAEATLELSDKTLEDAFELSDKVFNSSEVVFDLPQEVIKRIKQSNINNETTFFKPSPP